ncbi:MAG: hydroxyethylthiazole kinase [Rhodospirillales bacterium]|nr:hydroxyethylthiazole kinase [Rhodospirillales bacterium]
MTPDAIAATLTAIRARRPLVHGIVDFTAMTATATALLAFGASPAMVEAEDEVAEFAAKADALVIDLGTLSAPRATAIRLAVAAARAAGIPWVLDPVAFGATRPRTALAQELLTARPAVVRGNGSDIAALTGAAVSGHGILSIATSDVALAAARRLAIQAGMIVAVTGANDCVTDGRQTVVIRNGDPSTSQVIGLGGTATALIGACLAVERDPLVAAAHALVLLGVAGEIAAARAHGPGSLQVEILDALAALDAATLSRSLRIDQPSG